MFRTIQNQWVVGLILIGLAVGGLGFIVAAQEMKIKNQLQPRDFILYEIGAGSVWALVGGVIGWWIFTPVVSYFLPPSPSCHGIAALGQEHCWLAEKLAWALGNILGTSLAVAGTGWRFRVHGNIAMTFIGAAVGVLGLWEIGFQFPVPVPGLPLIVASVIPAVSATIGFNLGATMDARMSFSPISSKLVEWQMKW
ncbi:hypothetical protein HYR54_17755 [Candidatus Acetothermia bacterium]|nr:hypothetical protein [Candidatus Acetothermia bacterium]